MSGRSPGVRPVNGTLCQCRTASVGEGTVDRDRCGLVPIHAPTRVPGEARSRGTRCHDVIFETLIRNPVGIQSHPAKVGRQPEPSDAWAWGDPGREAFTGSAEAHVIEPRHALSARADALRWAEGHVAASEWPWRWRPRRGRSAGHACGWVSREPGRPRRLHPKDCRGAGTGSPSPRPWTSHLASDGANRRCSDGTAGRRQRSAGGWAARSRSVS